MWVCTWDLSSCFVLFCFVSFSLFCSPPPKVWLFDFFQIPSPPPPPPSPSATATAINFFTKPARTWTSPTTRAWASSSPPGIVAQVGLRHARTWRMLLKSAPHPGLAMRRGGAALQRATAARSRAVKVPGWMAQPPTGTTASTQLSKVRLGELPDAWLWHTHGRAGTCSRTCARIAQSRRGLAGDPLR